MATRTQATIEDLYRVEQKAELVDGRIRKMSPAGDEHSSASLNIGTSLKKVMKQLGGRAYADNAGFLCNLPHRQSFSLDAAFYKGPRAKKKFLPHPPVFAVEIRSENDYGPAAEREIVEKRDDYFATGITQVVWDVDLESDDIVRVYRASDPTTPTIYRLGELAEAEPAVPGWTMPVDELFD